MCAYVLRDDLFGLIEPAYVMRFKDDVCRDLRVIWCAMVRLMADWLSSRMIVEDVWGKPRSDANWRKKVTSLAHLPSARYSASQGLRATPDVSAEECTANGALKVSIWMV